MYTINYFNEFFIAYYLPGLPGKPGYGEGLPYWLLELGFWYEGWYTEPGKPGVPGWPINEILKMY